ncbi:MAG TPA: hypothetical protein VHA33_27405 [Candidatus Angelobacter sp.]|jgi:hypothetical protein|nr:hypothetical protein [Candidatus Angelobacter sp.]
MRTHFKSAAACAIAVTVIVAATSFLVFQMMSHPDSSVISPVKAGSAVLHIVSAAGKTLLLAYIAGAWVWITMFALRRFGVHRLAEVSTFGPKD